MWAPLGFLCALEGGAGPESGGGAGRGLGQVGVLGGAWAGCSEHSIFVCVTVLPGRLTGGCHCRTYCKDPVTEGMGGKAAGGERTEKRLRCGQPGWGELGGCNFLGL